MKPQTLNQLIIELVKTKHPKSIEELVRLVQERRSGEETDVIIEQIERLVKDGKILLKDKAPPPASWALYLRSRYSVWFWVIVSLTVSTTLTVFFISERSIFAPLRWVLGLVFCFYLPGYCLLWALFPSKSLDVVERIVLSVALSLALLPIDGLVVNFTVGNITLVPIMLSLSFLTLFFAVVGCLRQYRIMAEEYPSR